jgi:hypothetical protein
MSLLSAEIETVLKGHGVPVRPQVLIHGCSEVLEAVRALTGEDGANLAESASEVANGVRKHRVVAVVSSAEAAGPLVRALNSENLTAAVIALQPGGDGSSNAQLRAQGVMDVLTEISTTAIEPLLRRGLDFSALLTLELAHRCESRRLMNRELELLGQPPESMSDDLSVFQPPPLPVGPLSVYDLDEASESFETAYIDRVQQLCASAREAAVHLGVSSATLSRRLRREGSARDS